MAIASTDIKFYHPDVTTEGPTHGGTVDTTSEIATTKNGLWDDVSGAQAQAGLTEYRKVFVGLGVGAGTSTLSNTVVWIATTTAADDEILMQTATQAAHASDVQTAATTYTFTDSKTTKALGLTIGNIDTSAAFGVWLRRDVPAATNAYANNQAVMTVEGDTA